MPRTHVLVCSACNRAFCIPIGTLPEKCLSKKCDQSPDWREATAAEIVKADRDFLRSIRIASDDPKV